jgi:hypothetical protein
VSGTRCRVRVCRDCCCGTARKHPGVDHDGLVGRLAEAVGDRAEVSVTTCLLACDRSNVVVVSPGSTGRRKGERPVWLGEVLDTRTVDAIASWVVAGGPGRADLPAALAAHRTTSPSQPSPERSLGETMGP